MNDDQITDLAREFAEWVTKDYGKDDAYIPSETATASIFLRWLCKRFCLVEKSKVEEFEIARRAKENGAVWLTPADVCALFPEIGKEVEE